MLKAAAAYVPVDFDAPPPYIWAIIEYVMFPALMSGGKMFIVSPAGHQNPEYLAESICSERVDAL